MPVHFSGVFHLFYCIIYWRYIDIGERHLQGFQYIMTGIIETVHDCGENKGRMGAKKSHIMF